MLATKFTTDLICICFVSSYNSCERMGILVLMMQILRFTIMEKCGGEGPLDFPEIGEIGVLCYLLLLFCHFCYCHFILHFHHFKLLWESMCFFWNFFLRKTNFYNQTWMTWFDSNFTIWYSSFINGNPLGKVMQRHLYKYLVCLQNSLSPCI